MKKTLQGLTDVHCHILPYVDDGARNMDEALEMISIQQEQGVSRLYLTPHHRNGMFETPTAEITHWFEALKAAVASAGIPNAPELLLGREYHCDSYLKNLLEQQSSPEEELTTMGRGRGLLMEFSGRHTKEDMLEYISLARRRNLIPIVAHVERYALIEDDPSLAEKLVEAGAWLQVNASSILGEDGRDTKKLCQRLLKEDKIRLIGTDTHRTDIREPNLEECAHALRKKIPEEQFNKLFYRNPWELYGDGNTIEIV